MKNHSIRLFVINSISHKINNRNTSSFKFLREQVFSSTFSNRKSLQRVSRILKLTSGRKKQHQKRVFCSNGIWMNHWWRWRVVYSKYHDIMQSLPYCNVKRIFFSLLLKSFLKVNGNAYHTFVHLLCINLITHFNCTGINAHPRCYVQKKIRFALKCHNLHEFSWCRCRNTSWLNATPRKSQECLLISTFFCACIFLLFFSHFIL